MSVATVVRQTHAWVIRPEAVAGIIEVEPKRRTFIDNKNKTVNTIHSETIDKKLIIGLLLIVASAGIGLAIYLSNQDANPTDVSNEKSANYTIPGVPYYGIYVRKGEKSYAYGGDTGTAMTTVLEYWNPGVNNLVEVSRYFATGNGSLLTGESLKEFVRYNSAGGLQVSKVHLEIEELKKYINPETRSPLIFFQAIDGDHPAGMPYHPARVLIGVNEVDKKVTVHDFWLGNNYEISFDEFKKSWERMRPDERNNYTLIQPVDLKKGLEKISARYDKTTYPARTRTMQAIETMAKDFAKGRGAYNASMNDLALEYFDKVKASPNYEKDLPPYLKVRLLAYMGNTLSLLNEHEEALVWGKQAVEMNHDLDKPFNDWPGYDVTGNKPEILDRLPEPEKLMGDIYSREGDIANTKIHYQRALDIKPDFKDALERLDELRIEELSKSKQNTQ